MLITTVEDLRLSAPAHAFDSIDSMVGFFDNSEHSFLEPALGTPLYDALCQWYSENPAMRASIADYQTGYYNRLLLICQRCVAFDALGRSAGMQAVSVNNAGINQMSADDYKPADDKSVQVYRDTCYREAMKSLDILLATLERWTTEETSAISHQTSDIADPADETSSISHQPSDIADPADETSSISHQTSDIDAAERAAIVSLWRKSRYFYLAAQMLIPSAVIMQQYLDISDSREKFIRLLPDLRFIQEEVIVNAVGEEYLDHLIDVSVNTAGDAQPITTKSPVELRIIHHLRRVMVALLISRTKVIKYDKEQKVQAHDDGVRKLTDVCDFIRHHQHAILCALDAASGFPATAAAELSPSDREQLEEDVLQGCLEAEAPFVASPLFVAPASAVAEPAPDGCHCAKTDNEQSSDCDGYRKGDPACWTPPLF